MHRATRRDAARLTAAVVAQALSITLVQAQAIRVGNAAVVARAPDRNLIFEPHLAVHPADPSHFLAVAIVGTAVGSFEERESQQTCASFLSLDAGKTWERHDFVISKCADPWVAITPDGQALFTSLGTRPTLSQQGRPGAVDGLIAFHSADGGRMWDEKPVGLGRGHDHPTTVVDVGSSMRKGWMYVVSHRDIRADDGKVRSSVFVARSRDGGKTFDEPVNVVPNNLHNLAEMAAVASDGTLVVSFVDAGHETENPGGGSTFERRRAWVVRSTDGGHAFSMPLFANDACGPPPKFRLSSFVTDTSAGPFRDRLYFACRQKAGGPIVVNYSKDGGETWSDPVAANGAPSPSTVEERIPGLAVNAQGVLGVGWIDGRDQPGHRCEQEVHFSASTDGGRTFLPERRVSIVPACSDWDAHLEPTGGDYFGMVTTPDDRFHLLWSEMRDGISQLRTTTVEAESMPHK